MPKDHMPYFMPPLPVYGKAHRELRPIIPPHPTPLPPHPTPSPAKRSPSLFSFLPLPPSPPVPDMMEYKLYAGLIDIITASQIFENAIHAPDAKLSSEYVKDTVAWLEHARDQFAELKDDELVARVNQVIDLLNNTVMKELDQATDFKSYQKDKLSKYMLYLFMLYKLTNSLMSKY